MTLRLSVLHVAAICAVTLAACGSDEPAATQTTTATAAVEGPTGADAAKQADEIAGLVDRLRDLSGVPRRRDAPVGGGG